MTNSAGRTGATRARRRSSLGSNTTHWVPSQMDRSRKMKRRHTLTYFHNAFDVIVTSFLRYS
jgi:hypothetical protein